MIYLDLTALISFLFLLILLIFRAHRIQTNADYRKPKILTTCLSWLLLVIFLVSLGSITYGTLYPQRFNQFGQQVLGKNFPLFTTASKPSSKITISATKQKSSATKEKATAAKKTPTTDSLTSITSVTWNPTHPSLTNGQPVNIMFSVPKDTGVVIKGHTYNQQYGKVIPANSSQRVNFQFNTAGTYDIVINQDGNTSIKTLVISPAQIPN